MHKTCVFVLAFLLWAMPPAAHSAVTNLVVDITTRPGVVVRVLYNAPDAPIAHLIVLVGIYGDVGIQPNGAMLNVPPDAAALIGDWVAAGVAFTIVDTPFASPIDPAFRRSAAHAADLQAVIQNLRQRTPVPVWLMGLGSGAISAASVATRLFPDLVGVVLSNPHTAGPGVLNASDVVSIHGPTLVINHADDACFVTVPADVPFLFSQLVNASARKHVVLTGGDALVGDPCNDVVGPHAYSGLWTVVIDTVVGWIRERNGLLDVAKAPAIEYFHAEFGHYFIAASTDEITKLDNGTFTGWARTNQSFNIGTAGGPGRVPVCRFFTLAFPPTSSHFYAPRGLGCEGTLGNADWQFEGDVFFAALPDAAGACPPNYVPVYRLYNQGQGGAPNHRFTTSQQIRADMLAAGYIPEGAGIGVGMCSPQ